MSKLTELQEEIIKVMKEHGEPVTKNDIFMMFSVYRPIMKRYREEIDDMVNSGLIEHSWKTGFYCLPKKGIENQTSLF